ncbi:MAG: SBBP repeat-containing protein [Capsulimonadaceae bacterium]|nr:SBBP repeat-containing protein [Capsulimonadaceae bacterium]
MNRVSQASVSTIAAAIVALVLLVAPPARAAGRIDSNSAMRKSLAAGYGRLPLQFEPNEGQTDKRVKFITHGAGQTLYLTGTEAVLSLTHSSPQPRRLDPKDPGARFRRTQAKRTITVLRMGVAGANADAKACGLDELPGKVNYFIGNDPKKWHTNIPTYRRIAFRDIYKSVDLVYYDTNGRLEYDFVVMPGGDPSRVELTFSGAKSVRLTGSGDLALGLPNGDVVWKKPVVYQLDSAGRRKPVAGSYVLAANGSSVRFAVAKYDAARPLVIDPALAYSTYLGGSDGNDICNGIAVDSGGNAYVTGADGSSDFPTTSGSYQTVNGGGNAYVTKLNAAGSGLVFSTYIGGGSGDSGAGIALDSSGNAYITGTAYSTNFPTTSGAFQRSVGSNYKPFVAKVSASGSELLYSTFVGGSGGDSGTGIAVDSNGNAYISVFEGSTDYPTTSGSFQSTDPQSTQYHAAVSKVNSTGTGLVYSTYLGGNGQDGANAIAVDSSGNAYVGGFTESSNFPTTSGAYQRSLSGLANTFVVKLNPAGSAEVYGTLVGSTVADELYALCIDTSGNAYFCGNTDVNTYPVTFGAFQTAFLSTDEGGFVTKLNSTGMALVFSTFLNGAGPFNNPNSIAVDSSGNVYVSGNTTCTNWPTTTDAYQTTLKGADSAFMTELAPDGKSLVYSTYLGGSGSDTSSAIAVDSNNNVYIAGYATSTNFPVTAGAYDTTIRTASGNEAGFVAKFGTAVVVQTAPTPTIGPASGTVSSGQTVAITDSSISSAPGFAIYYTTDNSTPTTGSTRYTGELTLTANETVKAIAVATGYTSSSAAVATYTVVTHFSVSAPTTATAGTPFLITVTALDSTGAKATGYGGTIEFSTTAAAALLHSSSTLTNGAGSFQTTLDSVGSQTITATDTDVSSITGTSGTITVSPGAATHFAVSAPSSATAGVAFSITVTALDDAGNTATGYTGVVHYTSTDGQATLPADAALTSGAGTLSATLKTSRLQTITATDTTTSSIKGTSGSINVSPGSATHLAMSMIPNTTAGIPFSLSVSALDAYGNVASGYAGTIHFTCTDSGAGVSLPADSTLTSGLGAFISTLVTAGSQTITATDTANASMTVTSNTFTISPAAATHIGVVAPSTATSGAAFSFTVTALDQFGNTATGYSGVLHYTTTDAAGGVSLPGDGPLTNGTGTLSATLVTSGSQTITATDTSNSSITGASSGITVGPGPATHFTLSAPGTATAGTAFSFTITALDANGNTATGYTGTVHFTSTDAAATLPADATLTNGTGAFSATLVTAGSQTITATDASTSTIKGSSGSISVSAAAATHFTVSAPGTATAGTALSFTVSALDQYGNAATGYRGTVHFTKTDSGAGSSLPSDYTFTSGDNGLHTFTNGATLVTAGSQTITATDTATSSISGTSGTISVGPGAATHFTLSTPGTATAGTALSFTVTALDAFGNTATGYSGTVHFTSTDGAASLPANATLTNGTGTFSATLKTVGSRTITATDTATSSITGTSGPITVNPGAATHFTVSAPGTATAGTALSFTVTALDAFGNTATGYGGTVHFTSTDGAASLPANATLTNGTSTFSATLKTAGSQTITATDATTSSITGTSGTITVGPGAATHFTLSAPSTATAGTALSFTVTAFDAYGNTATGYGGTVGFTSTDSGAGVLLPANSSLTSGAGTFSATLVTAGSQTITATDTTTSSIKGTSAPINVAPGAATHFSLSVPAFATTGSSFSFTSTALDAYGNTATGYKGTVKFKSSDGAASLPANSTLTNGVKTFTATLNTVGNQTLTATDTTSAAVTGTSAPINVGVPQLSNLWLANTVVVGGQSLSGSVTTKFVSNPGISVTVGSSNATATVSPTTVTVPANGTIGMFTILTQPVAVNTLVTITASYHGQQMTQQFTITAPTVYSTSINKGQIQSGQSFQFTVNLSSPAPTGGFAVPLTSSSPSNVSVPPTITVPAGTTTATVTLFGYYTGTSTGTEVNITAGGVSTQIIAIQPGAGKSST